MAPIQDVLEQLKYPLKVRNVRVNSQRTSVRLEPPLWEALEEIARCESLTRHELVTHIAQRKGEQVSLSSAIRTFICAYLQSQQLNAPKAKANP